MGRAIGRIEIFPDPPALAHYVAEWMTLAAQAAPGLFRVSLWRLDAEDAVWTARLG